MGRILCSIVIAILVTAATHYIVDANRKTEKQNITYNVGRVVSLGQCKDNKCSYGYTDKDGELKYATYDKPVTLMQLVYQQCWHEEAKGDRCYVDYYPSEN